MLGGAAASLSAEIMMMNVTTYAIVSHVEQDAEQLNYCAYNWTKWTYTPVTRL